MKKLMKLKRGLNQTSVLPNISKDKDTSSGQRIEPRQYLSKIDYLSQRIRDLEKLVQEKASEIHKIERQNKRLSASQAHRDKILAMALEENRRLNNNLKYYHDAKQKAEIKTSSPTLLSMFKNPNLTAINAAQAESKEPKSGLFKRSCARISLKPVESTDDSAIKFGDTSKLDQSPSFNSPLPRHSMLHSQTMPRSPTMPCSQAIAHSQTIDMAQTLQPDFLSATFDITKSNSNSLLPRKSYLKSHTCNELPPETTLTPSISEPHFTTKRPLPIIMDEVNPNRQSRQFTFPLTPWKDITPLHQQSVSKLPSNLSSTTNANSKNKQNAFVERIKFTHEIADDRGKFARFLRELPQQKQQPLFDYIKELRSNLTSMTMLNLRLKKLHGSCTKVSQTLVADEALDILVDETCELLKCDRASVFVVDYQTSQIATRVAKGTNIIRIPINSGIVGHVVKTGVAQNIENAYEDDRFNSAVDYKNNYKTSTILALPIRDKDGKVTAVIQAINKLEGTFSSDDQAILDLLSQHAAVTLRNATLSMTSIAMQHKLGYILDAANELSRWTTLCEVFEVTLWNLKKLTGVKQWKIFIIKEEKLISWSEDNGFQKFPSYTGIAGHSLSMKRPLVISNMYADPYFNSIVDLETTFPVIIIPIYNTDDTPVGVIQYTNIKGVGIRSSSQKARLESVDEEMMKSFSKVVATTFNHFLSKKIEF